MSIVIIFISLYRAGFIIAILHKEKAAKNSSQGRGSGNQKREDVLDLFRQYTRKIRKPMNNSNDLQ